MGKVYKETKQNMKNKTAAIASANRLSEKRCRKAAEKVNKKYPEFDYYVEVYNSQNAARLPNTIGLNVFFPNAEKATHWMSKEYPLGITDNQIEKFLKDMCKELSTKIPKK